MATIYIDFTRCRIEDFEDQNVLRLIDERLSYDVQGFGFMKISNRWDGKQRLMSKSLCFPVGMLSAVEEIFTEKNIAYRKVDNRTKPNYGKPMSPISDSKFSERDYQRNTIKKCIAAGSGIVKMCTGSGKSFVIASLVAHYNTKSIIYVVSIDLLHQMVSTLKDSFGIDAGIIGDGHCNIKQINVMTIWTAGAAFDKKLETKYAEDTDCSAGKIKNKEDIRNLVRQADVIILDECQYGGSDTFQFLDKESKKSYNRFLFSGTPWRESGDDILLEAVAGEKIVDVSASMLIKKGFLVRPNIVFKDVSPIRGVGKTYPEVYSKYIINNDERNNMAVEACKNFVKKDLKVLILFRNINHGEIISEKLSNANIEHSFLSGKDSTKDRDIGVFKIKNGEVNVILASTIFDVGVDIPILDALINMGGGKSTGKMLQRIGRVIRSYPGKDSAYIIDFYDQCKYLRDHSQVRYKTACSEKEFNIKRVK